MNQPPQYQLPRQEELECVLITLQEELLKTKQDYDALYSHFNRTNQLYYQKHQENLKLQEEIMQLKGQLKQKEIENKNLNEIIIYVKDSNVDFK